MEKSKEPVLVRGRVNYDKKGVANVLVRFISQDSKAAAMRDRMTKVDGGFELELTTGKYTVVLLQPPIELGAAPGSAGPAQTGKDSAKSSAAAIPRQYQDTTTTPFKDIEINDQGRSDLELTMTTSPR